MGDSSRNGCGQQGYNTLRIQVTRDLTWQCQVRRRPCQLIQLELTPLSLRSRGGSACGATYLPWGPCIWPKTSAAPVGKSVSVAIPLQIGTDALADLSTGRFSFSQCAWKKLSGHDASYLWARSFQRVGEPAQCRLKCAVGNGHHWFSKIGKYWGNGSSDGHNTRDPLEVTKSAALSLQLATSVSNGQERSHHFWLWLTVACMTPVWRPEDSLWESVSSSTVCVPGVKLRFSRQTASLPA